MHIRIQCLAMKALRVYERLEALHREVLKEENKLSEIMKGIKSLKGVGDDSAPPLPRVTYDYLQDDNESN